MQYIILLQQALVSHWRFPLLSRHWLSKINARKSQNRSGGLAQIFVHVVAKTSLPLANRSFIIFDSSTSSCLDSNFVNDEQYWKFSTLFQWNPLALHRQRTNSMPSSWTTRSAPTSGITISSVPISKKKRGRWLWSSWSRHGHARGTPLTNYSWVLRNYCSAIAKDLHPRTQLLLHKIGVTIIRRCLFWNHYGLHSLTEKVAKLGLQFPLG